MGKVTTLNGMSGGPVFICVDGASEWSFAGVLVRGNDAGLAHFVEARVPWYAIRATMRAQRNAAKRFRREVWRKR